MTTVIRGDQIFEEMLGDIDYDLNSDRGKIYSFKVRVGCVRRRPPRHGYFDYIRDMGRGWIEKVMTGQSFQDLTTLTFVFPERWLGIAEQQAFMHVLAKHPNVDQLEQVDLITSSPLLIGNFHREMIRILSWEDDDSYGCGNGA